MPYQVYREGNEFCVHKKNPDGSKGTKHGCHPSRGKALAQMRALYAAENKELTVEDLEIAPEEETENKETKMYEEAPPYISASVTTFADYDSMMDKLEVSRKMMTDVEVFKELAVNIAYNPGVEDKAMALQDLASEFASRVKSSSDYSEDEEDDEEKECKDCDQDDEIWHEDKSLEFLDEKAVWTTAYVNNLPDSAFLYITPGCGSKDGEGKTKPRSCRHLPVKGDSGAYDAAHVRNAIARIPQMKGVPSGKKSSLQERARRILARLNKGKGTSWADELIDNITVLIKSKVADNATQSSESSLDFMLWKESNGRDRFLVRYSNIFRDDDHPPEIISSDSHRNFVRAVENKEAEMPQLWLWHVPEWRLGACDWIAYDESGFALASGLIDVEKEAIAESIAAKENVACSHGMPTSSIERDPVDPTIISKHITSEISLLPHEYAANKLTSFVLLGGENKEEGSMAIPSKKREQLIEGWGVEPTLLDKLEAMNEADAAKAREEGRDYKETNEDASNEDAAVSESTAEQDAAVQDASHPEEQAEQTPYPTREEVADAIIGVFQPYFEKIDALSASVDELSKQIGEVAQDDEEKVKDRISEIPAASVAALIAQRVSAVGAKETQVDGRSSLAKAGPKETPAEDRKIRVGVPFIDSMLNDNGKQTEPET